MCKHVAAVLYGVGARLDQNPELLFRLRRVDAKDLVSQAGASLPKSKKGPMADKVLDHSMLADVFGIEMDEATAPTKGVGARKSPASAKGILKKGPKATKETTAKTTQKPHAIRAAMAKKSLVAKPPAKNGSSQRKLVPGKSVNGKSK
jgi:uncharacterized Zn finger protein